MATFGSSADFRRPVPESSGRIDTYQPPQESTGPASALYQQGAQTKELGAYIDQFGRSLDETAAQDALNQLRIKRQELTADPEKGFMRIKGGDVLQPGPSGKPWAVELPDQLRSASDEISAKLFSPRAKAAFRMASAREQLAYKSDLVNHMQVQSENYQAAVYKDTGTALLAEAAQNYNDPQKLESIAQRAAIVADNRSRQTGLPSQATALRSNVYRTAVESLLASGNGRQALSYYDSIKGNLDGPDTVALAARLKATATDVEGDNLVASYGGIKAPDAVGQYAPLIQQAAATAGVKPALVAGVMSTESQGVNGRTSSAGAQGLMQLMPGTARDLGVTNVLDETQNVNGGAQYLKQMLDKFGGNERLALMAYNWGPGNVENWIKTGSDPEKVPFETREYVQKVQGYAAGYGGSVKADLASARLDLMSRTDVPVGVKINALAKIEKVSSAFEAYRTAQAKTLDDTLDTTTLLMIAAPATYQKGSLLKIADAYDTIGEHTKATDTRMLAQNEDTLLAFAQSPDTAQKHVIESLLSGRSRSFAKGLIASDKEGQTQAAQQAASETANIKIALEQNGVPIDSLKDKIAKTVDLYNKAGAPRSGQDFVDYIKGRAAAAPVANMPPGQQSQFISDLEAKVAAGHTANADIQTLDAARKIQSFQTEAFAKDPLAAGAQLYATDLGPLPPPNDLAARSAYAAQVSARRGNAPVPVLTAPEIAQVRQNLDTANPQGQEAILRPFAALPPEQIPRIAAKLAGKEEGSPLSRSYAAALSFFAEKDPQSDNVARLILDGAQRLKEMGESGKKPSMSSPAIQQALVDRVGNAFGGLNAKVPGVIASAVESAYVSLAFKAGRQNEAFADDLFTQAMDAVIGQPITRNGQTFLPPKGVDQYQIDNALRTLTDADLGRAEWSHTKLSPQDEAKFQADMKASPWYAEFQKRFGEAPDLSTNSNYDYRGAWKAGIQPQPDPYDDNSLHWPSALPNGKELKSPDHPTLWKEHFMQATGKNPDELGLNDTAAANKWLAQNGKSALPVPTTGLHTLNGSPVTADKIARYGRLVNGPQDGKFFVEFPDPANNGAPAHVLMPNGQPYVLDIRPLLERAKDQPTAPDNTDFLTLRRRGADAAMPK